MSEIYRIKSFPASIAFSGGRTSGYMLYRILDAHNGKLPDDVIINFENTGEEVEATYNFIHQIEQSWNCKIIWLEYDDKFRYTDYLRKGKLSTTRSSRDFKNKKDLGFKIVDYASAARKGEPYDKMLLYYWQYRRSLKNLDRILPTRFTRMCTSHLKIKTSSRYMQSLGYKNWDSFIGIRYDEPKRWSNMAAINNHSDLWQVVYPLVTDKIVKEHVLDFWGKQPFDLQLDPNSEEGNCRLCFLKKNSTIIKIIAKILSQEDQSELQRWLRRESLSGMKFRKDRPDFNQLVQIVKSGQVIKEDPLDETIDCFCGSPAV